MSAEAGYRGRRGISLLEYQNLKSRGVASNTHSVGLNLSSSLAYTPNAFGIGQPINDSFAIFRATPSLKGNSELLVGSSHSDNAAIIDSIGPGVLSNLSSQNSRTLLITSSDPNSPIYVKDQILKLDPKFYRGIELMVEQSKPLALKGVLLKKDRTPLSLHSGMWRTLNGEGLVVDSGEIFSSAEGEIFIESKEWGPWLEIDINYPETLHFKADLSGFENSNDKVSDLGELL